MVILDFGPGQVAINAKTVMGLEIEHRPWGSTLIIMLRDGHDVRIQDREPSGKPVDLRVIHQKILGAL